MNSKFYRLPRGCFLILFSLVISCSLSQELQKPEGQRFLQEPSYLEKLARERPKTQTQSHLELASLYVSYENPQLDYSRALQEMEIYLSLTPDKAQAVEFQNWLAALRQMDRLRRERVRMGETNRALQMRLEELEINLEKVQEANRNLRGEVASLKEINNRMREMIEKLKTLDRQMEDKRDLIK